MIRRFDSGDGFTTMLGAGYDAGRGKIPWRIAQFDRMVILGSGGTDAKNVRVSSGLVLRFWRSLGRTSVSGTETIDA
jgi:hypothetical protein